MNGSILSVTDEQWAQAQKDELHYWSTQGPDGDDWNAWWQEQFDDYRFLLNTTKKKSLLEVGCGPFAGNMKRITKLFPEISDIHLNDPLFRKYIQDGKSIQELLGWIYYYDCQLEELTGAYTVDNIHLTVCINVLDHVRDVAACFDQLHKVTATGGTLIIGQDLTSEFDMANCKEMREDTMHPIKISLEAIAPFIFPHYSTEFLKILPREKGRNPKAHYATLCWAGRKR